MSKRISFARVQPDAYKAMGALDAYVSSSSIDKVHGELIKIRASQINGCAYCVNKHSSDARKLGVTEQKVYLVSAWKEAGEVFTEEERLILAMTEEITLIHQNGLSQASYEKAIFAFGEEKTAQIIMAIITINAWNRIGVATEMHPPVAKPGETAETAQ
ncbi:MAG: carboxymuconolactone decarboxylase family protein [Bacteroidetes bacterium]|nr:carboxymuconolactone decarboxylase family protein [Bacteroidota bacterium]